MLYQELKLELPGRKTEAKLITYLLDESGEIKISHKRPLVLICPGGGYRFVSDREAEAVAMTFLGMGFHAAVLRYSVAPAVFPQALLEAAQSMKLLKEHAKEWHIDQEKIVIAGFSAGGHLAASLGVFWNREFLAKELQAESEMFRPAGMILSYPVIISGEHAHRDSFTALLGERYEELLEQVSLEKQVGEHTPQAFLWHTFTDDCVPVQNSLLFVEAMKKFEIPAELHIYPAGGHGLSLADKMTVDAGGYGIQKECQNWVSCVKVWLDRFF